MENYMKCLIIPVCTRSPVHSSDIVMDFPFSSLTIAPAGKQPPHPLGAGVGAYTK